MIILGGETKESIQKLEGKTIRFTYRYPDAIYERKVGKVTGEEVWLGDNLFSIIYIKIELRK